MGSAWGELSRDGCAENRWGKGQAGRRLAAPFLLFLSLLSLLPRGQARFLGFLVQQTEVSSARISPPFAIGRRSSARAASNIVTY